MKRGHLPQRLPNSGPAREALRERGQFWTPSWVAEAMVAYVLQGHADHLFDPAVGSGAFFHATRLVGPRMGVRPVLLGYELDARVLQEGRLSGLSDEDLAHVEIRDFLAHPPLRKLAAIVANPPYIRHHRLPADLKLQLKLYGRRLLGVSLDGRAGLHVYFLLQALEILDQGGRLAFILPADVCEGKSASLLWNWITAHFRLDAVITFAPEAAPFPQVDTNAMIFLIRNVEPTQEFAWARCVVAGTDHLRDWVETGFKSPPNQSLQVYYRRLDEAIASGLSRPPSRGQQGQATLSDFASVRRGIATGANDFFFLTRSRVVSLGLPEEFLVLAIGRTRDVDGEEITQDTMHALELAGRPTLLLSLDGRPCSDFPPAVQAYLRAGEALGLPHRPLISQRKPWYRMETREAPPFLFAYLGRRSVRFIRNHIGVLPLTGFLCVYPHERDATSIEKLWKLLSHPTTVANLARVGKSYGSGAIKVEPRALESLPLSDDAVQNAGLQLPKRCMQLRLLEKRSPYPIFNT